MKTTHRSTVNVLGLCVIAALLAAGLAVASPAPVAHAATLTVNSLNDNDDGACNTSHCSLREAIKYAASGDTVTFSVTGDIVLNGGRLTVDKNLTITGPGRDRLSIAGGLDDSVFSVEKAGGDITVAISGLMVHNGQGTGGGIRVYQETLTLADCVIRANTTPDGTTGDAPSGGGVYAFESNLTIERCSIRNNYTGTGASNHRGGSGAGLFLSYGTATIRESEISGNTIGSSYNSSGSTADGGGIYSDNCDLTIENSTISGNLMWDATGVQGAGGGLYIESGSVALTNVTISGNRALRDGGGIYVGSGTVAIAHSTITGNTADDDNSANGAPAGAFPGSEARSRSRTPSSRATMIRAAPSTMTATAPHPRWATT